MQSKLVIKHISFIMKNMRWVHTTASSTTDVGARARTIGRANAEIPIPTVKNIDSSRKTTLN